MNKKAKKFRLRTGGNLRIPRHHHHLSVPERTGDFVQRFYGYH